MILAILALELAMVAPGQIDDEWARVNSCGQLAAFRVRWGERSRYSRYYVQVSRRHGCTRPDPQPDRRVEPVQRQPPSTSMTSVTLDASGRGDVTTLSAALDRVATGGTVLIRPGTYAAGIPIRRSVTLRGSRDASGSAPTLRTTGQGVPVIHVYAGSVILDTLTLRAEGPQANALYVLGGNVTARDVQFTWAGRRVPDDQVAAHATIFAAGDAIATIERSRIGPGSSQALAISGRANVAITDSMITNAGGVYGIFLNGGALRLHKVNISNADSALVAQNDGRASLSLVLIHSVNYRARFPIFATDNVSIQVEQSVICIPSNYRWETTRGSARITPSGIYGANGAVLHTAPRTSDLADQARRLCADRF